MKNPRAIHNDMEMLVLLLYKLGVLRLEDLHETSNAIHRRKRSMDQLLTWGGY